METRTLVPDGNAFPNPDSGDLVVVLGGPMSVYEEDKHPWLRREKRFLRECLSSDVKLLGICLGAQLIADVLGADVYPMDDAEKGWHPVTWTPHAREHELTNDLPRRHRVFHWHGDTFDVPEDSRHIARSEQCEHQAFLVPETALGLQFHLEITEDIIQSLLSHAQGDTSKPSHPDPEPPANGPGFPRLHAYMSQLLDQFLHSHSSIELEE